MFSEKVHHQINRWSLLWGHRFIQSLVALKVAIDFAIAQSYSDAYTYQSSVHLLLKAQNCKPLEV
jgi:hypothetical protein